MVGVTAERKDRQAGLSGTKLQIAEAALETLTSKGFAGASARAIAQTGGFNQALIFYHFGSVQNALLAALDLISARRLNDYGPAFETARTPPELAGSPGSSTKRTGTRLHHRPR